MGENPTHISTTSSYFISRFIFPLSQIPFFSLCGRNRHLCVPVFLGEAWSGGLLLLPLYVSVSAWREEKKVILAGILLFLQILSVCVRVCMDRALLSGIVRRRKRDSPDAFSFSPFLWFHWMQSGCVRASVCVCKSVLGITWNRSWSEKSPGESLTEFFFVEAFFFL